ncbi:hypothetical protein ACRS85_26835 [Pluralibacter gergoviae]
MTTRASLPNSGFSTAMTLPEEMRVREAGRLQNLDSLSKPGAEADF